MSYKTSICQAFKAITTLTVAILSLTMVQADPAKTNSPAQTATTNEAGFFRFINLPPGNYDVSFQMGGFKTLTRRGVHVQLIASAGRSTPSPARPTHH